MTTHPDIERLQMHPSVFQSYKYLMDSGERGIKRTFLIGMPRSGTTLWARLIENACYTRCVGDKSLSFYEGLVRIYRDIKEANGKWMDYRQTEKQEVFADDIRGYHSKEAEMRNFRHVLANLLFANTFRHGFAKSTIIGFGNKLTVAFVEMLRDVFAEDDLTICFMTRDIPSAVDSLRSKQPDMPPSIQCDWDMTAHTYYDDQRTQMRAATELGDVWIKYEDFIQDPIPFIKRSRPLYQPNATLVDEVMQLKLR
jgi:hypothetical protein